MIADVINTLISNISITCTIKKKYAYVDKAVIEPLTKEEKQDITKYMASGIFSKIGQTIVTSTDNIIISTYLNTLLVGIYSNYSMVINGFDTMIYLFFSNITASIGNFALRKRKRRFRKII